MEYKPLVPYYKEQVVQLPPEDVHMIDPRTRNLVLKRKHPKDEGVSMKKYIEGTDISTRNVWDVQPALPFQTEEDDVLAVAAPDGGDSGDGGGGEEWDIKPFAYQRRLATVDIHTMRKMPWVDFSVILREDDAEKREEAIMTLLQNNIPDDNNMYYIYHDQGTNTFSVEVDEDAEEVRDLIEGVYVIDAQLKHENYSARERKELKNERKTIIEILKNHYGDTTLSRVLSEKMTPEKRRELEEQIYTLQQDLNQDRDEWFYNYNEQTEEFELMREDDQSADISRRITAAIIRTNNRINSSTSRSEKRGLYKVNKALITYL